MVCKLSDVNMVVLGSIFCALNIGYKAHAVHFQELLNLLAEKFDPLQIISFSYESTTHQSLSCFKPGHLAGEHDYCLLVITETNARIDHQVQDFANAHYKQGTLTILCHSQSSVDEAIAANNRFFISVFTVGKLLYSRDRMMSLPLAPDYDPSMAAVKALKHYEHRLGLAEGFLTGAGKCLDEQQYATCVFMLHQVVEQTCIGLVRVHLGYRSEFHNLQRLLRLCCAFSDQPLRLFLTTAEDLRLFGILSKSYSEGRYSINFSVSPADAQALYKRIAIFLPMAHALCNSKIDQLSRDAEAYHDAGQPTHLTSNQFSANTITH